MTSPAMFVETILENPVDDGPRLVYADWLEERGDLRSEFIRLQCELANRRSPTAAGKTDADEKSEYEGPLFAFVPFNAEPRPKLGSIVYYDKLRRCGEIMSFRPHSTDHVAIEVRLLPSDSTPALRRRETTLFNEQNYCATAFGDSLEHFAPPRPTPETTEFWLQLSGCRDDRYGHWRTSQAIDLRGSFKRGFVNHIWLTARRLPDLAPVLLEHQPIESFTIFRRTISADLARSDFDLQILRLANGQWQATLLQSEHARNSRFRRNRVLPSKCEWPSRRQMLNELQSWLGDIFSTLRVQIR